MRRRKRRHGRYNNHIWLYSVIACICLLTMGVGYAILSAENNIQIDVTKTIPPAADTIKELLGSNSSVASGSGTLEKIEQPATAQTAAGTEYRYRGKNPNNYVTFNGETAGWRIIGIVDGKVKLVNNEKIGDYAWNSSGTNEWPGGNLQTYLNGDYYNSLTTTAKSMIEEESTWYLGGWNTASIKTNVMYQKERGTTTVCTNYSQYCPKSTKTTDKIAIMYPSDYGYAASSSCSNSYDLSSYNNSTCTSNNWLRNDWNEYWTLSPYSGTSGNAFIVSSSGHVYGDGDGVGNAQGVRPVLYLKSNILIFGGDGSSSNPYTLILT